jgi:hypothetical protein
MPESDPSQPKVDAFFRPVSREESAPLVVGVAQTSTAAPSGAEFNAAVRLAVEAGSSVVLTTTTTATITPPAHPAIERAKKKQEFADRRAHIVANMGRYKWLGQIPEYKTLVEDCAAYGWKPCTSLACTHPIKELGEFFNKGPDGKQSYCKACTHGEGGAARLAAGKEAKQRAHEVVQATKTIVPRFMVENEASDHLKEVLSMRGVVFEKTLEFRRADAGVKPMTVVADAYTRVQVKSDGAYDETGAPKPNNPHCGKGGGRASFHLCKGYKDMWMLFVKTRLAADGTRVRKYWLVEGEDVDNDQLHENADGMLGPKRFAPVSIDYVAETLLRLTLPTASMATLNIELRLADHRKEVTGMRAIGFVTGHSVTFTAGNQTSVDCTIDNRAAAQVKRFNLKAGYACASHKVNGVKNQPYHATRDGLDLLFEYLIVKSGADFYFLYAVQPRRKLIKHGIFAHDGTRKLSPSIGQSSITIPFDDELSLWLIGQTKKRPDKRIAWLRNPLYNFTNPVKITAAEIGVPPEWLEEAAQPAANPAAFPSTEFLAAREARIDEACRSAGTKRKREE